MKPTNAPRDDIFRPYPGASVPADSNNGIKRKGTHLSQRSAHHTFIIPRADEAEDLDMSPSPPFGKMFDNAKNSDNRVKSLRTLHKSQQIALRNSMHSLGLLENNNRNDDEDYEFEGQSDVGEGEENEIQEDHVKEFINPPGDEGNRKFNGDIGVNPSYKIKDEKSRLHERKLRHQKRMKCVCITVLVCVVIVLLAALITFLVLFL